MTVHRRFIFIDFRVNLATRGEQNETRTATLPVTELRSVLFFD